MADITDIYALTPMQQGMLFHSLYAPESGTYFEQCWCVLKGSLDRDLFKEAWRQVIQRHDVLRTEFHWQEVDTPVQLVYDQVDVPWDERDWQAFDDCEQRLQAYLAQRRAQGFALDQAPLLAFTLIKEGPDRHRFIWHYHHMLMDGWCGALLVKEVLALYQGLQQQQPVMLDDTYPYRDYIDWLAHQDQTRAETYWCDLLQGFTAPTAIAHPVTQTLAEDHYQEKRVNLDAAFSTQLSAFAQRQRLTINTLIQGAWALLLARRSGDDCVVFGATVSGRPAELAGIESMVGLFLNSLPVLVNTETDQALNLWLQDLQQQLRRSEQFAYSALSDIQRWSEVEAGNALFDSLVIFENYPLSMAETATEHSQLLQVSDTDNYERTNFPLSLKVIPGDQWQLGLSFLTSRIDTTSAEAILAQLQHLLHTFLTAEQVPVNGFSLLNPSQQQAMAAMGEGPCVDITTIPLHRQIADIALRTPQAIALRYVAGEGDLDNGLPESETLNYQQLDQRVQTLARQLFAKGVNAGDIVAVCQERSPGLVISLLAVLHCGAAYVPLDPNYPKERIDIVLEDAGAAYLLMDTCTAQRAIFSDPKLTVVNTDDLKGSAEQALPEHIVSAKDLAYIIFTSGSTGRPKGVPIEHVSLNNFIAAMCRQPGIDSEDQWLALTTLSFDIAVLEIFGPLVSGATVVMAAQSICRDAAQMSTLIPSHNISIVQATPATWRILAESDWAEQSWPHRRRLKLLCGGEALDSALARQLLSQCDQLWNMYGPTETTIWSAALALQEAHLQAAVAPVGAAIDNTQLLVLDSQHRPVPVGVSGELYIAGAGLSPGYWQRDDLSAEKFITAALPAGHTAKRWFKTGDGVRFRADGSLEFLGRLDGQIKLQGYRIELGEIEALLYRHPAVEQAAAVLKGEQGEAFLAAYICPSAEYLDQGFEHIEEQLRKALAAALPHYMQPSAYQLISDLPLTPNGKVDRKALPDIHRLRDVSVDETLSPQGLLIAGIWENILDQTPIQSSDHFFERGGHSLLATRVMAELNKQLAIDLPLRCLFDHPVLKDFIAVVEQECSHGTPAKPAIEKRDADKPLLLSYAQQRQWLMAKLAPDSSAYVIPTAVELKGPLDISALQASLQRLVDRHESMRSAFPEQEGEACLVINPTLTATLQVDDLSALPPQAQAQECRALMQRQAQRGFDLATAPLWECRLLHLAEDNSVLVLTLHHIIADEWSLGILIKELTQGYQCLAEPLPALAVQYSDYAAWQRGLDLSEQRAYWQQQLLGASTLLSLPTDFPRPVKRQDDGALYRLPIDSTQWQNLKQLCRDQGVTEFMCLLSVFTVLLHRYTGSQDINIGTPIANRQNTQVQGLIGLLVNTLVIRTILDESLSFADLLKQTRNTTLDAYTHQDIPFEDVLDGLSLPRSGSYTPLFQVFFATQQRPEMSPLDQQDLQWSALPSQNRTSKFDISLTVQSHGEGATAIFEYSTQLFKASSIERMAEHFTQLLNAVCQSVDTTITQLPLMNEAQLQQQLCHRGPATDTYREKTVAYCFAEQQAKTPEAIALSIADSQLTYRDLNGRANQLAQYLQQQGIQPQDRIGLWDDKSADAIVAMLAIVKCGAVYVPLTRNISQGCLNRIEQEAELRLIISPAEVFNVSADSESISFVPHVPELSLQNVANQLMAFSPTHEVLVSIDTDAMINILYPLGSTQPTIGVCTAHRGIVRLVKTADYCQLDDEQVILQSTPLNSDVSNFEIWGALLNGGRLVLMDKRGEPVTRLAQTIQQHQVNTLWLTAGLFHEVVDQQLESLLPIKQLFVGGDSVSLAPIQKAMAVLNNTTLMHVYGARELTSFACCHRYHPDDVMDYHDRVFPIGRPINDTQVYVLDKQLQPVPIGVPGELYIGGRGLALHYAHRADLTAERFIPNPFVDTQQWQMDDGDSYLFRSGDYVYWRDDGGLVFLNHHDKSVKAININRDLAHIEHVIQQHPSVQQVMVVNDTSRPESPCLFAYLVAQTATDMPGALQWRQYLLQHVPEYRLPAQFIIMERFPLDTYGKVDRKALPEPVWHAPTQEIQILSAGQVFWQHYLAGHQEATLLTSADHISQSTLVDEGSFSEAHIGLSREHSEQLRYFCQKQGIRLNTFLQGALAILLGQYTASRDVIFGHIPIITDGIEPLPVRVKLPFESKAINLLHRLQEQQGAVYTYRQDYDHSKTLFDCLLVVENEAVDRAPNTQVKYPLTLFINHRESLEIDASYQLASLSLGKVSTLLAALVRIMQTMIAEPNIELHALNLLDDRQWQQQQQWNAKLTAYQGPDTLTALLEQQRALCAQQIAIVVDGESLSYEALHQQADILALQLQAQGIGPEDRVALYLQRSANLMVALLAIMKVGAVYVPVEPSYPDARRQWILNDSQAVLLLMDSRQELSPMPLPEGLYCWDLAEDVETKSAVFTPPSLHPDNAVYTLYTSGSTGKPKGVINTHRGVVNRLKWMQSRFPLTAEDRVLLKTPLGFDVSVWELFWPLITGARLVIAKPEGHKDPSYLIDCIEQHHITTLHFVPPMLSVLLEAPNIKRCAKPLTRVILSGEALSLNLQQRFFSALPEVELHNLYGPTEAAIDVTAWACQPMEAGSVPIGHPIANTQIYLLDEAMNPVPQGVPGELYIGGANLARAYLNRPDLTAERFVPNPFMDDACYQAGLHHGIGRDQSTVLYQTGDLARYREDGAIEYISRLDHQVKIRGVRIELGEIEQVLQQHTAIKEAVLMVDTQALENKRLVAYLVSQTNEAIPDTQSLRHYLLQKIPESVVPAKFIGMDRLPLNSNGKVDRKALPDPMWDGRVNDYSPPQSPMAQQLVTLWQSVLKTQQLGINDNFFDLGGDSILAIQIVNRARSEGIKLEPSDLFHYQTIAELEAVVTPLDEPAIDDKAFGTEAFDLIDMDTIVLDNLVDQVSFGEEN